MPIYVPPDRFWGFYQKHEEDFESDMLLVAESTISKTRIYLTSSNGFPALVIENDGSESTVVLNDVQIRMYTQCLTSLIPKEDLTVVESKYFADEELLTEDDLDRINLIQMATYSFLSTLFQDSPENYGIKTSDLECIASRMEEILYDNYGVSVLHPTVIEDDEGSFVVRYPFEDTIPEQDEAQE